MNGGSVNESTVISLEIPAKAEYLVLGRLVLTGLARSGRIDQETLADLKLALTEAAANAIVHAYDGADTPGVVRLRYQLDAARIAVEVEDRGDGTTTPETVRGRIGTLEQPAESGMGLAIIRALVDELELESAGDGRGLRVRFAKQLDDTNG